MLDDKFHLNENTHFIEELEELDSNLSFTCVFLDLICEVLAGIGSTNALQQEVVIKWTKLFFGDVTEPIIRVSVDFLNSDVSFTYL